MNFHLCLSLLTQSMRGEWNMEIRNARNSFPFIMGRCALPLSALWVDIWSKHLALAVRAAPPPPRTLQLKCFSGIGHVAQSAVITLYQRKIFIKHKIVCINFIIWMFGCLMVCYNSMSCHIRPIRQARIRGMLGYIQTYLSNSHRLGWNIGSKAMEPKSHPSQDFENVLAYRPAYTTSHLEL